jgi:hypothetical protein
MLKPPFDLAYSIPLLLLSLILTFAGTFLTLDRTRSFTPKDTSTRKTAPIRLEGGIGGLAAGYTFGLHLATFLTVLISNKTSAKPLGSIQFLITWLFPAIVLTFVGGRWKIAALVFLGLSGSVAITLFLSVAFHPTLLARLILLCITTPILTIACLIPKPNIRHTAARVASSFTGSFGVIVTIALLGNIDSWGNVWLRFVLKTADGWGSGKEKGLSAALALLCLVGAAVDWTLKKKFGENPDEQWDTYLANYASGLPANGDREGVFQPLTSFWQRIFSKRTRAPLLFPSDAELGKRPTNRLRPRTKSRRNHPLAKSKFRPLSGDPFASGSEDGDSDLERGKKAYPEWSKKRNVNTPSLSGSTLYTSEGGDHGKPKEKDRLDPTIEYSDGEGGDDAVPPQQDGEPWKPVFLRRHESQRSKDTAKRSSISFHPPPPAFPMPTPIYAPAPSPGGVPATPSLLNAINRVQLAHTQAMSGADHARLSPPPRLSQELTRSPSEEWKGFWADVREKVAT